MKKVFATLLVAVLAVFSFAAFDATVGYVNTSLTASDTSAASNVTFHGLSVGANYVYEDLGFVEGGALVLGGSFDYYFKQEELSQMDLTLNVGYRQDLEVFFPGVPVFVEGLFNYSFGLGDSTIKNALAFGGGVGTTFVVQNLDVSVGADILFAKPTLAEANEDLYKNGFGPKFKIYAGVTLPF